MRLGCIDYLNCFPFYYHMLEKQPLPGVEIVPAYPSALNGMMNEGVLDMGPMSAAEYADIRERTLLLPQFALSSVGYVKSVVLLSNHPIEELSGKTVGLSNASKTSVVLLKILLQKHYGLSPRYLPAPPRPDLDALDAALVIGNEAMMDDRQPVPFSYDLGDLWLRRTGHPVVFAVFAVQREYARAHDREVRAVIDSYRASLDRLASERERLIAAAARRYPDIRYDIDHYYTLLQFEFTDALKKALQFYFDEAAALSLLPRVPSLVFFPH